MLVIVDGYNVLRSSGPTARLRGESLCVERERFISRLRKYQSGRQDKIIAVFDGATQSGSDKSDPRKADTNQLATQSLGGMSVVFSRRGQTADEIIKSMVEQNTNPENIIVVSSDRDVVDLVRSLGASVTGARSLADKLELLDNTTRCQKEIDNSYEYSVKGYIGETTSPGRRKGNPRRRKRNRQRLQLWSFSK